MSNLTDITDLSDDALDVVLAVRSGAECVDVEHLSPVERTTVCAALGVSARPSWIYGRSSPSSTPRATGGRDYEGAILAEQDRRFQD